LSSSILGYRTDGPVNGRALRGEHVHLAIPGHPGRLYSVRGYASHGQYALKLVGHDIYTTNALRGPEWTFHPEPDTVVMTTRDGHGNEHTWRMGGVPAFADRALNARRALKRHWVMFTVPYALVTIPPDWYWTSSSR
jgi:hypothetical protein